ncbi:phosphohistidine phosphatase [Haloactinopolyspora alba]|uniref:Phosphohistidine phosphatase n=1 Tax=Haloactinopolyspora alba TaxID=648780 RepID=A0A2P8DN53_9ACTN|nr:histidine phosphatase family protein [Haloactinopolyspora alba]PSK98647.1 phosphohistidine phosphatase [Haloactinopolyspora alba]
MVKTLVLVRHAKAANPEGVPDHERPLSEQGRRDAPEVGRWLQSAGTAPQVALVSSAARTQETFQLLAGELATAPEARFTDEAYYAGAGELLELIRSLPEDGPSAVVVAHNPGISSLANALDDGESTVEDTTRLRTGMPTSSLAMFRVSTEWSALDPGTARLTAFAVARG